MTYNVEVELSHPSETQRVHEESNNSALKDGYRDERPGDLLWLTYQPEQ